MTGADQRICVGQIVGVIGIKGELRVRPFTETPDGIAAYGPVTAEPGGMRLDLKVVRDVKGGVAARAKGYGDRTAAEALVGKRLYIERTALPTPEEDEFYHADLIGLRAEDDSGGVIGRVASVHDFGAGAVLEIERAGAKPLLVPFNLAVVPVVDVASGRLVVIPPVAESDDAEGTP